MSTAEMHMSREQCFDRDSSGFYVPECVCGWSGAPVPDLSILCDALMAHAVKVVSDRILELEQALHQHGHIVDIGEDQFGLLHPVECRTTGLLNCPVNGALAALDESPRAPGRYEVSLTADGELVFGDELEVSP